MHTNLTELIQRGSSTAKAGFQNEKDIIKKFNNWKGDKDAQEWLGIMAYPIENIEKIEALQVKGSHKADIQIKITVRSNETRIAENISIKLASNPQGFNQIDKRRIDKYVKLWAIPQNVSNPLRLFTGETMPTCKNTKDPRRMFLNELDAESQTSLMKFFDENKTMIISDLFKGRDEFSASWMIIYQKHVKIWTLLPIAVVIKYYASGDVRITKQGGLKIGRVGMQRKGGDQGRESAKMLQFKFNPCEIVNNSLSQ